MTEGTAALLEPYSGLGCPEQGVTTVESGFVMMAWNQAGPRDSILRTPTQFDQGGFQVPVFFFC